MINNFLFFLECNILKLIGIDMNKNIKNIWTIRNIIMAIIAIIILTWAFFKNNLVSKIIISPFLVCAISILGGNICILLNKNKLAKIFHYIFKITFLIYVVGFLSYTTYYSFKTKEYSLLIIVAIFVIFIILFFRLAK